MSKRLVDLLTLLKLIETIKSSLLKGFPWFFACCALVQLFHLDCSNKSKITHNSVPSKVRNLSYLEVLSRNFLSCSCLSPQIVNYSGENKNMEVKKLPQNSPVMMDSVEIIVSLLVSHRYTWWSLNDDVPSWKMIFSVLPCVLGLKNPKIWGRALLDASSLHLLRTT